MGDHPARPRVHGPPPRLARSKRSLGEVFLQLSLRITMYEDSWFGYVSDSRKVETSVPKHRRRESLLKQTNGNNQISEPVDTVMDTFQEQVRLNGPPQATLTRRAKSYSDFYGDASGYLDKDEKKKSKEGLELLESDDSQLSFENRYNQRENDLLNASHDQYQLYRDQLAVSERHLDSLLNNTSAALDLLATLSDSFKMVDSQTSTFQAQCEDLVAEQNRLRDLAAEIGSDLQYSAYPPIRTRLRDTFLPFRLNNIISLQPPPS